VYSRLLNGNPLRPKALCSRNARSVWHCGQNTFHTGAPSATAAFAKLSKLLRYVDDDYSNPTTFQTLRQKLNTTLRPTYYLTIPPAAFGKVVGKLKQSGCMKEARIVVEKPFGRDLASARKLKPGREVGANGAK